MSETKVCLDGLCLEALPKTYRVIAEIIGVDAMVKLCNEMGGARTYIPHTGRLESALRHEQIKVAYDKNGNTSQLAREFRLSESQIRRIVHDKRKGK